MTYNLILDTDSYKSSHFLQYPPGTSHVSSYIEARGYGKDAPFGAEIVFFGLQAYLQEYLSKGVSYIDLAEAELIFNLHGEPFNRSGWEYIIDVHNGKLPVKIEAVPEGSINDIHDPLVQVINTDPNCYWLTSYLETAILRAVWYPSTVATISREAKKLIAFAMDTTSDSRTGLEFKLHDFGARGVSSNESAALGGMAHLVNFMGTDTVAGIMAAKRYYNADMPGFSIPAAEHSTITSWGRSGELSAYKNMLDQFSGEGKLVAVVSDSYDIYKACSEIWGESLHDRVAKNGGTIVIRPDSGDPLEVPIQCMEILGNKFGKTLNSKGFKVLPPYIRIIQGDGVNLNSIRNILDNMMSFGWSADNIAFGMGGGLLQQVNRDTFKWAMKASAACVDNVWRDVYKDPVTDKGKQSRRGIQTNRNFQTVFENGEINCSQNFEEIRARAAINA